MAIPERWLDSACHPGPGLGPAMRRARGQEIGQIGDASAAIEAVVPLARIARQMLGADAVEGAVEPGLHIAEQDMDDGQHGIGVFAAVLDDRVVAEAVGEAVVALQTISDDAGAAGDKVALLDALAPPRRGRDGFDRAPPRRARLAGSGTDHSPEKAPPETPAAGSFKRLT